MHSHNPLEYRKHTDAQVCMAIHHWKIENTDTPLYMAIHHWNIKNIDTPVQYAWLYITGI